MGYLAQQGVPITILHPVRDINGNYVAGQASAVTKELLAPDRSVDVTSPVVLTDFATGWVKVVATLPLLGQYDLLLTNPADPVADGRTETYSISVGAGVAIGTNLLTSLDRVKQRMGVTDSSLDSILNLLISETSDEIQGRLGRTIAETDYIQYLDGNDRGSLVLGAGPLVSFTSLQSVEYRDDGAGGVTEVYTLVPRSSYVLSGLRASPRFYGLGRVDLISPDALFTRGVKNYRAIFRAGFSPLPEGLVGLATENVVFKAMTRETGHLLSKVLGDGQISYMRPQQMRETTDDSLSPYLLDAA